MAKLSMGTLDPLLCEDIFNATVKAFTEVEQNKVGRKSVVCIEEADGVVKHALGIWKGNIYNPNQLYVLEQSQLAFDTVCVKHKFCWLKELYGLKILTEVQSKTK
jgi:hypothetical protein